MMQREAGAVPVGVMYNPALPALLPASFELVDFVAVIPDGQWEDRGEHAAMRFRTIPLAEAVLHDWRDQLPVVGHGVGLSIGTAGPIDFQYLRQIRAWIEQVACRRFSEHLTFAQIFGENGRRQVGVGLPVPCDRDTLDWLVGRVDAVQQMLGMPILLENGVSYAPIPEQQLTEPAFLSELAHRSGCAILLDLHNLYVDCTNHGWSATNYLAEMDLDCVREVHVAGGAPLGDMYTDAHSGACPAGVWELLDAVLPRCARLEGITFEFHESYAAVLGSAGLRAQLERARRCSPGAARVRQCH